MDCCVNLGGRRPTGLVKEIEDALTMGIKKRFAQTIERKKHADESVEAVREFVEACVDFAHYCGAAS